MKRLLSILVVALALAPSVAWGQSANDLTVLYLSANNIAWAPGDWSTCRPQGGADGICTWNTAKLGTQPTSVQLQSYATAWQSQQTAKANAAAVQAQYAQALASGVVVSCASGATVCTPAITGTYTIPVATAPQGSPNLAAQLNVTSIASGIQSTATTTDPAGASFAGGATTVVYYDAATPPQPHTFTLAQWREFQTAMYGVSNSLQSAYLSALSSGTFTVPSNTITLQ